MTHTHHGDHSPNWAARMQRLNDVGRLDSQVSEADLAHLLALRGDEDVLDLGSGTGFYTDRIAPLTTGLVYALELIPEMNDHYRERGLPSNVRLLQGDMTALAVTGAHGAAPGAAPGESGALEPSCVDVVVTIATWHEIGGRLDLAGVAAVLRPGGRLLVIDWHKDPVTWDFGPPEDVRYSADEVTATLKSHFMVDSVVAVGSAMFALSARRK